MLTALESRGDLRTRCIYTSFHKKADHYRPQTNLRRLYFYICLSFCSQGGYASVHAGIPPPLPLGADPPGSRPHLGADPPGSRPPEQIPHPPGADTPPSRPPLGADPNREQTPPQQPNPPRANPPPREQRRLLLQTVRILLECILVSVWVFSVSATAISAIARPTSATMFFFQLPVKRNGTPYTDNICIDCLC